MRTVCLSSGSNTSRFPVSVFVSFSIWKFCYGYSSGPSKSMDTNGHDNMGQCGDGGPDINNMRLKRVATLLLSMMVVFSGYSAPRRGGEFQAPQDTLKVSVDLVNVQFSVTDKRGRFVPGLTAQD